MSRYSSTTHSEPDWLISPWFDLIFVANLGWLAALVPAYVGQESVPHVEFWQIYFLTLPHRWLTLWLVATDPDRRDGRDRTFVIIAVLIAAVVLLTQISTGGLTCLLLIDFLWNYWHFAAQHAGIVRVYSRRGSGGKPWLETWSIRLFVFYVALRLAGWTTGWLADYPWSENAITLADTGAIAVGWSVLFVTLLSHPWRQPAKLAYLLSVLSMYTCFLFALRTNNRNLVLALTVASAMFHAVEYMALVSHYAWRRRKFGSACLFQKMAGNWLRYLALFVLTLGGLALLMESGKTTLAVWLSINVWASALHYCFDGMIWKLRRPPTAQALGVQIDPATT